MGVGQEKKPNKNAHILTVNIAVSPSAQSSTLFPLSSSMKSLYPMLQKSNTPLTSHRIFANLNVKTTQ